MYGSSAFALALAFAFGSPIAARSDTLRFASREVDERLRCKKGDVESNVTRRNRSPLA